MDISVIVVTYNQEATIARTLNSILSQRVNADMEILVADDCSTDSTEKICRDFASRFPDKIVYLRRDNNLGVVRNYFDCIERAHGEFLADCAGDDFWVDPDKLQKQLDFMRSNPDVTMVATDFLCLNESTGSLSRHEAAPLPDGIELFGRRELLLPVLTQRRLINLCTALYRKAPLAERISQNPEIFINPAFTTEDLQIVLSSSEAGKVAVLPDITLHYSVGHSSLSHPDTFAKRLRYSLGAVAQTRTLQLHFGVADREMKSLFRNILSYMAAMAFRAGDTELRDRFDDFRGSMPFAMNVKGYIYTALMRHERIWSITRHLIPQLHG